MGLLQSISEGFRNRSFNISDIAPWLAVVGSICALLCILLVIKALRARKVRYNPHGSVTDPKAVRAVLREAFDQRRPFEIQVAAEGTARRPTLRCSGEYLGANSITIELNGLRSLSDRWLGRKINVFFRIHADREFIYYTFPSHIQHIHAPKQGICHITLPIPQALENRQKRSFLRMAPPEEYLLGAALWCDTEMPPPERMDSITLWPAPKLLLLPGKEAQFHIVDLSAGGMRLHVPHAVIREQGLQFASVEQLIILLDLVDPENGRRLRYWLLCRIQNVWLDHNSRDVHLGIQFSSWARPRDNSETDARDGSALEWLKLSGTQEVEPIGNWVMRRHLEMFRDVPAE